MKLTITEVCETQENNIICLFLLFSLYLWLYLQLIFSF